MDEKCYRGSIANIPEDQYALRNTSIPLFFSVEFEKHGRDTPVVQEPLIRCTKCKAYLNPYVEVIMPGYKWRCNLCGSINEVAEPFVLSSKQTNEFPRDPIRNSNYNRTVFTREDLRSDVYEIEAPDSFSLKTPEPPTLCFLIEVTTEAQRLAVPSSVISALSESLPNSKYDPRTKVCFAFFSDRVFLLNTNNTFSVVSGSVPRVFRDHSLFSLYDTPGDILHPHFLSIDFSAVLHFLANNRFPVSNPLLPLQMIAEAFRSTSVFLFTSTMPTGGSSSVEPSSSLYNRSEEYTLCADLLSAKNICVNIFVAARSNIELSAINVLSRNTGGLIFYYSNYDGNDPVSASKLFCDLTDYLDMNVGFGGVCRIRMNEGVALKSVYGHFKQRSNDLCNYTNFIPAHTISLAILPFSSIQGALYIQLAMIRVTKECKRMLRIFNIAIPVAGGSFYESCDAYAICHGLMLEAFYQEIKKKQSGSRFLSKTVLKIWQEIRDNYGRIPESVAPLPRLVSYAQKTIPLRPDNDTPTDFRIYYMYLFSNSYLKIVDLLIYPLLLDLAATEVSGLGLSINNLNSTSIYLLDTGVNIFFYVGRECDSADLLFEKLHSGPIIFAPPDNELSRYVSETLLAFLLEGRPFKPRFVLVLESEGTVYLDIFKSYMYEDSMFGLPSAGSYETELNRVLK